MAKGYKVRIAGFVVIFFVLCAVIGGAVGLCAQDNTQPGQTKFLSEYKGPQPIVQEDNFATFLGTLFKFSLTLVVIIVLIYVTVYVLKIVSARYKPANLFERGGLEIVDTLSLGQHKTLFVIKAYNSRLLFVAATEKELSLLDKIEDEKKVDEIFREIQERWNKVHPFQDHLRAAHRKNAAQAAVKKYVNGLTGFFQGLKPRK